MIHLGDCVTVMAGMPADSVDAVVTDPPYGIEFMGRKWDSAKPDGFDKRTRETAGAVTDAYARLLDRGPSNYIAGTPFQAWCEAWGREALRVTKPGGYLLAFGGTRTHHRLVCGLEDAGWIIRDELDWIYACLSDDTEILTDLGWVPYNRANEATHAAAFDTETGRLHWERIAAVHQYDHDGPMVEYGPAVTTLNHRVVLSPESQVPLPSDADVRRMWDQLPDVGSLPSDESQGVLPRVLTEAVVHASRSEAAGGSQGTLVLMRGMRGADVEARRMGQAHHRTDVLSSLQRHPQTAESELSTGHAGRLEARELGVGGSQDERAEQPSLEGRRYRVSEARELFGSPLRSRTGMGEADGPQGRLRDGAPPTDGGTRGLPAEDGSGEPREPRSDRQPSREPEPLAGQPDAQAVRMGQGDRGDGLPAGDAPRLVDYAGVVWCITVPSGAFVARRGGVAFVTGNSGFPKGKANLKPAHEPIVLARKPGPLQPLQIDECRIPSVTVQGAGLDVNTHLRSGVRRTSDENSTSFSIRKDEDEYHVPEQGRWPSNLLLSDPELFDEPNPYVVGSGATVTGQVGMQKIQGGYRFIEGDTESVQQFDHGQKDTGGYSRFFIVPKADRADREPVLRGQLEQRDVFRGNLPDNPKCLLCGHQRVGALGAAACGCPEPEWAANADTSRENSHPTVKPTDLMRHLVRLVTPSGGTVLDPFLGSGSTAIACELEGFPWIGIEQSAEYVAIAEARLNGVQRGLGLDTPLTQPARKLDPRVIAAKGPSRPEGASASTWFTTGHRPDEEPAA